LDQGRPSEVVELLRNETRADSLLLRLALAEAASPESGPNLPEHVSALKERFGASRQRGDKVHRREEARFTLHLLHQPREALQLAKENWAVQREPADARILLETALAAKDDVAADSVREWLSTNRLQDVRLAKLLQEQKN
jgi:hypothetical protein